MIYLDTNILLYATLSVVDNKLQQQKAINVLKSAIKSELLVLSNLSLLEYSFVKDLPKINFKIIGTEAFGGAKAPLPYEYKIC